jgi:predicted RNase H-like HicB family nuclease
MQYAVVTERTPEGFGARVPDLPGCAAVGGSEAEVRALIREAIELHIEGIVVEDGHAVPVPSSRVEYVHVSDAV